MLFIDFFFAYANVFRAFYVKHSDIWLKSERSLCKIQKAPMQSISKKYDCTEKKTGATNMGDV